MLKNKKPISASFRSIVKTRLIFVFSLLMLFAITLIARLADLQIIRHKTLLEKSEKQPYRGTIKIHLGRGAIFDRKGNTLATNLGVESVFVVPQEVRDRKYTSRVLAATLNQSYNRIYKEVSSKKKFVWIKRKVPVNEITHLKKSALSGVGFRPEQKRFYPKRELAANVIGFVGTDDLGLAGIEYAYQNKLKGIVYSQPFKNGEKERNFQPLENLSRSNIGNYDLMLTIDEVIQFTTEHLLKKQVEKYRADSGMAVVMDPNSGEIYAMANMPQFNPNSFNKYSPATRKNNAVESSYDPGSIFKPIVAAAALDLRVSQPEEKFFCENGIYKVGGKKIREAANHKFGMLSMQEIIANSSNIGAIKIAQKLGKDSFYEYIRKFGFGEKSKIRLPGVSSGLLRKINSWNDLSLASISFGHEIALACALGIFGSIDMNRNDVQSGWDTDQFPNNYLDVALAYYHILLNGGFKSGGTNFDAKLRRQSLDPEDLLLAHIGAMDTCALGFKSALKLLKNGDLKEFIDKRYSNWSKTFGKSLMNREMNLEQITRWVEDNNINPEPVSGKQEYLENIFIQNAITK